MLETEESGMIKIFKPVNRRNGNFILYKPDISNYFKSLSFLYFLYFL